jgi:hypothetical protein
VVVKEVVVVVVERNGGVSASGPIENVSGGGGRVASTLESEVVERRTELGIRETTIPIS